MNLLCKIAKQPKYIFTEHTHDCTKHGHDWRRIGLWSDRLYRVKPILRCAHCGKDHYVTDEG